MITPCLDLNIPLIIETKVGSNITEDSRQQLRNYLRSATLNKNAIIKKINTGLLINFKKSETFIDSNRKKRTFRCRNRSMEVRKEQIYSTLFQ